MLVKLSDITKKYWKKTLLANACLAIEKGKKIALIGRNGAGKTTLFKILMGRDKDFEGTVSIPSGLRVIMTEQEHTEVGHIKVIDYITKDIFRYQELSNIIQNYNEGNTSQLEYYCDALAEYTDLEYFEIEEKITRTLFDFDLSPYITDQTMESLSGGEKRYVELVRIMFSNADLALIDEPTNHLDYFGKDIFIKWLRNTKSTVIVITHDRDVLKYVDKIAEIKDAAISVFNGNIDDYLKQNAITTLTQINKYETDTKQIAQTKKQLVLAHDTKLSAKSLKGRNQAKIREERFREKYENLTSSLTKPSFWLDKETLESIPSDIVEKYHNYKATNINIGIHNVSGKKLRRNLLEVESLSLGYSTPLFRNISFSLEFGDRLHIKGRNGAGKSTLVKTLISTIQSTPLECDMFAGSIKFSQNIKIGVYEQEIAPGILSKTLQQALSDLIYDIKHEVSNNELLGIMRKYLFDPTTDGSLLMSQLSGGQKARFQLFKMLYTEPNFLILDEPTNHLDLPSIEELENALSIFSGAIIYISHDTYFVKHMQGREIEIKT